MKRLWPLSFIFFTACDKADFPKYSLISGLRILTIQATADQGEVNPGTTVTLQPVISDLGGGGRNLSVTVTACMDPSAFLGGGAPVCTTPDTTTQTSSFSSTTLSSNGAYIGKAPTVSVSVPSTIPLFSVAPAYTKYNGLPYLVIYTVTAPDGNSTTAIKRIVVSDPSKTAKNKNPAISTVSANGSTIAPSQSYTTSSMDLSLALGVAGENYSSMSPDGSLSSQQETITTTWYITDGELKYQRTSEGTVNHWDASKPASRAAVLVVVVTDGRGGEGFMIFEFN